MRAAEQKKAIKSAIASRRYDEETAGITVAGIPIDTGRDSQGLITGATVSAMLDSAYVCQWKTPGGFVSLDASQLTAIAQKMRAHVQACFDREAVLLDALDVGTYTESMLNEGWPSGEVSKQAAN